MQDSIAEIENRWRIAAQSMGRQVADFVEQLLPLIFSGFSVRPAAYLPDWKEPANEDRH